MRDVRPGPRIGMVHDLQFYEYFLDNGEYPDEGIKRTAYSNSGMMLLKPGWCDKKDRYTLGEIDACYNTTQNVKRRIMTCVIFC